MGEIKTLALCEGRHEMPSDCTGAIFANEINPLDLMGMMETVCDALQGVTDLRLYVTGLTVALVEVIKYCYFGDVGLTLLHFNRNTGGYYEQIVFRKPICLFTP